MDQNGYLASLVNQVETKVEFSKFIGPLQEKIGETLDFAENEASKHELQPVYEYWQI